MPHVPTEIYVLDVISFMGGGVDKETIRSTLDEEYEPGLRGSSDVNLALSRLVRKGDLAESDGSWSITRQGKASLERAVRRYPNQLAAGG